MTQAALRHHLRDLRKRRGRFASAAAAESETAALLSRLRAGSLERKAFEMSEVLGMPFKAVAAALGITERHLYRVRISMMKQIAADDTPAIVKEPLSPDLQQLELARTLLKYGHAVRAQEIATRVLGSSPPVVHAIEALTVRAMALSDQERYSDAQIVLDEAERNMRRLRPEDATAAARAIAMVRAYIPYRDGRSGRALELSEEALAQPVTSTDPFVIRGYIRDLIFLAIQHEEAGSPQRGLDCLSKAREYLVRLPVPPASELARIYIHSAFTRAALPEETARAHRDAEEGLKLAQWHGLSYEEVWANLALAVLSDMAAKPQEGLQLARYALQLASSVCDGDPLIRTLFITARLEGASGFGDRALTLLESARPLTENHGLLRPILECAQARMFRHRGETKRTIEAAGRAIEALGDRPTHYLGLPYLARAVAREKLGEKPMDDVERAVYYLERGGALTDTALALELSHAITLNRRDLLRSQELRAAAAKLA